MISPCETSEDFPHSTTSWLLSKGDILSPETRKTGRKNTDIRAIAATATRIAPNVLISVEIYFLPKFRLSSSRFSCSVVGKTGVLLVSAMAYCSSFAETAVTELNHLFETAQKTADDYVEQVRLSVKDAEKKAEEIISEAEEKARKIIADAEKKAGRADKKTGSSEAEGSEKKDTDNEPKN